MILWTDDGKQNVSKDNFVFHLFEVWNNNKYHLCNAQIVQMINFELIMNIYM